MYCSEQKCADYHSPTTCHDLSIYVLSVKQKSVRVELSSVRHRALCRITLLPVTHVLVDTWMLTVKLLYILSNVPDDLKWATNTHMTPFTLTFKA